MSKLTASLILCRRLFVGVTAAYLFTSLALGGSHAAHLVFYALALSWFAFLCSGPLWHQALAKTGNKAHNLLGRVIHALELIGFNIGLTLLLAELSLRAFALHFGNSLLISHTLDAHRLAPGRDYGAGLRGNRLGYPGPEFQQKKRAGIYRIAALGDSFAVGPTVPFADNYLTLLQSAQLGTEVYNFGVSGAGPREYLTILRQHALAFQPDVVLVSVFVGNDISEALPTPRHMDPRQHSLYLLLARCGCLLSERWRKDAGLAAGIPDRFTRGALAEQTFQEVEARRLGICVTPPAAALEKKWHRALGYLDRIVKECQRRRVPVAFILIPDEFQVNPDVLADALRVAQTDRSALDLELPQRRLNAFCAERGLPCLDLLPAFKAVPGTYAPRDTHWNVTGNRLAAERLSEWLKDVRAKSLKPVLAG